MNGEMGSGPAFERVLRAYEAIPQTFRADHWPAPHPALIDASYRALCNKPTDVLDRVALDLSQQVAMYGDPDPEIFNTGLLSRDALAARAIAFDQIMTERGYGGPSGDYLNGVLDSLDVGLDHDANRKKHLERLRHEPDEYLRGFDDGLLWRASRWRGHPDDGPAPNPEHPYHLARSAVRAEINHRHSASVPGAARPIQWEYPTAASLVSMDFPTAPIPETNASQVSALNRRAPGPTSARRLGSSPA